MKGRCARSRMRSRWSRWARATTTRAWMRRRWCSCWRPSAATRRPRPRPARCWENRRRRPPRSGGVRRWGAGGGRRQAGAAGRRARAAHRRDARAGRSRPAEAAGAVARPAGRVAAAQGRARRAGGRTGRGGRARGAGGARRRRTWPTLGAAQAFLAESLNAARDPGAVAAAKRATEINPTLVDGWRELGDAQLEAGELKEAEAAFRRVVSMDTTYGLGYAKLAQVLLEQARTLEALEAISEAARAGRRSVLHRGDSRRHLRRDGAPSRGGRGVRPGAGDRSGGSLGAAPGRARARLRGAPGRASELFQAALEHDRDGCHQTLVDYGDHLRRMGRIGDAVKLYRRAVAAVPGDRSGSRRCAKPSASCSPRRTSRSRAKRASRLPDKDARASTRRRINSRG